MKFSNIIDGLVDTITGDKGFSIENAQTLLENGAFRRAAAAQIGVTPRSLSQASPAYLQEHAGELRSAWRALEKDKEAILKPALAEIKKQEKEAAYAHYVNSGQKEVDDRRRSWCFRLFDFQIKRALFPLLYPPKTHINRHN